MNLLVDRRREEENRSKIHVVKRKPTVDKMFSNKKFIKKNYVFNLPTTWSSSKNFKNVDIAVRQRE